MDLRQREAVWHHRLAESIVRVRDDVGCVQKERFRQSRQRAPAVISHDDGFAERGLVQSLLTTRKAYFRSNAFSGGASVG